MKHFVGYGFGRPAGCFSLGDNMKIVIFFMKMHWHKGEVPAC